MLLNLGDVKKIDKKAVEGLLGVENSLAYKVNELEKHFHNYEDWFGLAGTPSASHITSDVTEGTIPPFQVDAGNDDWGAWVQIMGSDDTPNRAGMVKFDFHRLQVVVTEDTDTTYFLQIGVGASGAGALSAGTYSTVSYVSGTNLSQDMPIDIMMARANAGDEVWARVMAIGKNTSTLDFYFGLHEYVG